MLNQLKNWLEVRIGLDSLIRDYGTGNRVPLNVRIFSTLGFVTLLGFLIQAVSGVFLLVYYVPHADHAFGSVQAIMENVPFGWLFRLVHLVGANMLVAVASLHMLSVFFMGNYRRPRELTWVLGALLLYCVLLSGLTGTLLPWSQLGYWATTMITSMPSAFPGFGTFLSRLLRGGDFVAGVTLNRFFAAHVAIIPFFIFLLVALHLFLVRRIGLSATPFGDADAENRVWTAYHRKTHPAGLPYYPDFLLRQGSMTFLYLTLLFFFITFLPNTFLPEDTGLPADPQKTPVNVRPAWYFLAPYQLLKLMPNKFFGISVLAVLSGVFLLWPFLDVQKEKNVFKRPVLRGVFLALLAMWAFLLFWGRY